MILIAHRGNIDGPNPSEENKPYYIQNALDSGFDVEIDVWFMNNIFLLGHDKPKWSVSMEFLQKYGLWCHAKTIECLYALSQIRNPAINCFFHDKDDAVLTSYMYIWTLSSKKLTPRSICVLPISMDDLSIPYGICSDYVNKY